MIQSALTPTPPTDEVDWLYRPADAEAHAFERGLGRGWLRAKCRRIPLTIALVDAPASMLRCSDCVSLIEGTPGELTELWGK